MITDELTGATSSNVGVLVSQIVSLPSNIPTLIFLRFTVPVCSDYLSRLSYIIVSVLAVYDKLQNSALFILVLTVIYNATFRCLLFLGNNLVTFFVKLVAYLYFSGIIL